MARISADIYSTVSIYIYKLYGRHTQGFYIVPSLHTGRYAVVGLDMQCLWPNPILIKPDA
jgi:hypothetical protein